MAKKSWKLGGIKMATISFEKNIVLDKTSIENLVNIVKRQEEKHIKVKNVDTVNKVERGRDILRQLFSN